MDAFLLQIDTYLQSSLIASLAAAFLGGLLASLTPCIYPMIPITAGVIGHATSCCLCERRVLQRTKLLIPAWRAKSCPP